MLVGVARAITERYARKVPRRNFSPAPNAGTGVAARARMNTMNAGLDSIAIYIAVAALITSIVLPLFLDSRQSPKVSVRISRLVYFDPQSNATEYYAVSAINHGRSEVQINQVNVSYIKRGQHG